MPSELWQRLRAARRYADKRQEDIALACGVTRSAVAQWEFATPEKRTSPSLAHVKQISRVVQVPQHWLMDDSVDAESVWSLGNAYGVKRTPPAPVVAAAPAPSNGREERLFHSAVEFGLLQRLPGFEGFHDGVLRHGSTIALVAQWDDQWPRHAATLLMREHAHGGALTKHLILLRRDATARDIEVAATSCSDVFRTKLVAVGTPDEAAQYLAVLAKRR